MSFDAVTLDALKQAAREGALEAHRNGGASGMSARDIRDLVEQTVEETIAKTLPTAVTRAVAETFSTFGVDSSNKFEFTKDMIFVRELRTLSGDSKKHILLSVLGIMTAGVVAAVTVYLKSKGG